MSTPSTSLARNERWAGLRPGDEVVINLERERRQHFVFVAHVRNAVTADEWVEVRGGRDGEAKTRAFRPEVVYAPEALRGSRIVGAALVDSPRLDLAPGASAVHRVGRR